MTLVGVDVDVIDAAKTQKTKTPGLEIAKSLDFVDQQGKCREAPVC